MTYSQEDYDPVSVLGVLVDYQVEFVVVGGTAAAIHGADTPTLDTDVTPARTQGNLARLAAALAALGSRLRTPEGDVIEAPLDEAALRNYTTCATRTAQWGDLDLVFAPDGIEGGFDTLLRDAEFVDLGGRIVPIASAEHIERSREASYRKTQQRKYARGTAALTIAVDVAEDIGARTSSRAENAVERARRYRAEQDREARRPSPSPGDAPSSGSEPAPPGGPGGPG